VLGKNPYTNIWWSPCSRTRQPPLLTSPKPWIWFVTSGLLDLVASLLLNSPTRGLHMTRERLWLTSCSRNSRHRFSGTLLSRAKALILSILSSRALILAAHSRRRNGTSKAEVRVRVHTAIWLEPQIPITLTLTLS